MNGNKDTAQELINDFFEKTNLKITADDPAIIFILGFRKILEKNIRDYENSLLAFNHSFTEKTQYQLDYANEYFVNNSHILHEELKNQFDQFLLEIDNKNKDLNFILSKIQAEYDKSVDDKFTNYFKKISEENKNLIHQIQLLNADSLKIQKKIDTSKQRDVLMIAIGCIIGIIICVTLSFIFK